jgi:Uma2 family endonuclease
MPALIPGFTTPIEYPSSDGKPMAETDLHRRRMTDLIERLEAFFAAQDNVYVSGNLLVYYEEGNVNRHLSPDCFVVFGVEKRDRQTFRTWAEGAVPSVVFEITSRTTRREDTRTKRAIYQNTWEVDEYFLFDPLEDYLDPSLQGFRRVRGVFQPIKPSKGGSLVSRRLGLTLSRDGDQLRLHDTATGGMLLTAGQRAARAEAQKDQMAAELARLLAENAALKKKKN